jgi:hypothetical protein
MRVMLERREAEVEDAGWDDKECRRRTKVWRMARPEATEWYLEGSVTGTWNSCNGEKVITIRIELGTLGTVNNKAPDRIGNSFVLIRW